MKKEITCEDALRLLTTQEISDGLYWHIKIFKFYSLEEKEILLAREFIKNNLYDFDISVFCLQNISQKLISDIRERNLNYSSLYYKNILSHNINNYVCIKCGIEIMKSGTDNTSALSRKSCEEAIMQKVLG